MDCSSQGSSSDGISQVRILEWVAIFFSRGPSWPKGWTNVSCTGFFTTDSPGKYKVQVKLKLLSCFSLQPHGLESPWNSPGQNTGVVTFPFCRGSSQPRDWIQVSRIAGGFFTPWATTESGLTAKRAKNRLSPRASEGSVALPAPWFWMTGL